MPAAVACTPAGASLSGDVLGGEVASIGGGTTVMGDRNGELRPSATAAIGVAISALITGNTGVCMPCMVVGIAILTSGGRGEWEGLPGPNRGLEGEDGTSPAMQVNSTGDDNAGKLGPSLQSRSSRQAYSRRMPQSSQATSSCLFKLSP